MATKNEQFFIDLGKGASWAAGVAFQRSNPLPLDKYSVFADEAAATTYATTSAVAYPGQVIAYVDGDKMAVCVLAQNAEGTNLELQAIGGAIGDYETAAANTLPQKKAIYGEDGSTVIGYEVKWMPVSAIVEGDGNTTYAFAKKANDEKTLVFTPYDEGVAGEATELTLDFLTSDEIAGLIQEAKDYADGANTTYAISYGEYEIEDGVTKKAIRLLGSDNSASYVDVADFLKDSVLEDVSYDADTNTLTFTWNTLDENGNKVTTDVELNDMLSPYTAGNGIDITGQAISAKVKANDKYIEVTENGIASKGIDEAIAEAIREENLSQYTTEEDVKAIAYTKKEVYTQAETNTQIDNKIASVTGGESAAAVKSALESYRDALNKEMWGNDASSWTTTTTDEDGKTVIAYTPAYDTPSRIDTAEAKLSGIEANAQVNVIEAISVNGNAQTVTDKTVNIKVPVKYTDLTDDRGLLTNIRVKEKTVDGEGTTTYESLLAITPGAESTVRVIDDSAIQDAIRNVKTTADTAVQGATIAGTAMTKTGTGLAITKQELTDALGLGDLAFEDSIDTGIHAIALAGGTNNGTLKLTIDDNDPIDNIKVTGLDTMAYEKADDYYTKTQIGTLAKDGEGKDKTIVQMIADAQTAAEGKVTELANDAVKKNTDALAVLIGDDTNKSVRTIAADEINTIIGGVSDTDTIENIKTLIDYVNENGASVQGINDEIDDLQALIGASALADGDSTLINRIAALETAGHITAADLGDNGTVGVSTDRLFVGKEELIFFAGDAGTKEEAAE